MKTPHHNNHSNNRSGSGSKPVTAVASGLLMVGSIRNPKRDSRPAKGLWCGGEYHCLCPICGDFYVGDKRSLSCADCAYKVKDKERWEVRFRKWIEMCLTAPERLLARFLRRRGWVVFYMEDRDRRCTGSCIMQGYQDWWKKENFKVKK